MNEVKEKLKVNKRKKVSLKNIQLVVPTNGLNEVYEEIVYHMDNRMIGREATIPLATLNLIKQGIESVKKAEANQSLS